jgi:hypothetical protein
MLLARCWLCAFAANEVKNPKIRQWWARDVQQPMRPGTAAA